MERLAEWVIARDGGIWLVGKLSWQSPQYLTPVFELACQLRPVSGGRVEVNYAAQPLMLCPSLDRWALSPTGHIWPVVGSSIEKQVLAAVAKAAEMLDRMRAAAAGISLATSMPPGVKD